ncbi:MAG TPA: M64 family metallopeptidase [Gemmatimonadota bacterium]|nr:M64 family metallopeptidase [Gemmatimonadota bacterium]
MGAADGTVLGTSKLLDHGPDNQRYNIALLAEGFTAAQQADFDARCDELVSHLILQPDLGPMMAAVNVHKVNVASDQSGAGNPAACGDGSPGSGANPRTYFDATYCGDGELRRTLTVDVELVMDTANAAVPLWNVILLIVNATESGGTAQGSVATVDLSGGWLGTAVHELGHAAFDLADEYAYRIGPDAAEPAQDQYAGAEPPEANITTVRDRPDLKWRHLVPPHVPVPTMENLDCSVVDRSPNLLSGEDANAVGLFEGAGYFHCGIYRPAFDCMMRSSLGRFCAVCRESIHDRLRLVMPPLPALAASPAVLHFGPVTAGLGAVKTLDLSNPALEPVTDLSVEVQNESFSIVSELPSTIESGQTVPVEVELAPQFTEGSLVGELTFHSNAPDVVVALGAEICVGLASSQVRVGGVPEAPVEFGAVVQGLTSYRSLEVLNFRFGDECGAPLEVELPALPSPFFYGELPPGGAAGADGSYVFVIPAPGPPAIETVTVWVGFEAPLDEEGHVGHSLAIHTSAGDGTPDWPLTLSVTVVPPHPLDAVLVMDRSGSMGDSSGIGDRTRRDVAVDAASLFVNMLRDEHRIGIVRYNQAAAIPDDVLLDLGDPVGESSARDDALSVLASSELDPAGSTAIGEAMLTASEVLAAGTTPTHVMVVLTDGRQNRGIAIPEAREAIETRVPAQRVYAVGIGLDQYQREIQQIATVNGGAAHVTGELTGEREFLLHKLYAQMLSDVAGGALIRDPKHALAAGERLATRIQVCRVDHEVDFVVICRESPSHPKYMETWLEAPDGRMIDRSVAAASPGMDYLEAGSHVLYRVGRGAATALRGVWRVWVRNAASGGADLHYSVIAASRLTDLVLRGRVVQPSLEIGAPMTALLEPRLYGRPVAPLPGGLLHVERPDGEVLDLPIRRTAAGQYAVRIEDTSLVGAYSLSTELGFRIEGCRTSRFRQLTGVILPERVRDPRLEECMRELEGLRRRAEKPAREWYVPRRRLPRGPKRPPRR